MSRGIGILAASCAGCLAMAVAVGEAGPNPAAPEAPEAGYSISRWTVNGGGISLGGPYALSGTIGQPAAGKLTGGTYTLKGGFWSSVAGYMIHLPIIRR